MFKNMKTSHKIVILITLVVLAWMGSGVLKAKPEVDARTVAERQANVSAQVQTVRVKEITLGDMNHTISIFGKTAASRYVELKAETSGRVESIDYTKGTLAKKGSVILTLAVDDRESMMDQANASLKQKQIVYDAKKKLYQQGLSSISAVSSAESELKKAKAVAQMANLNLEHTKIVAPFEGVFEQNFVEIGDYVSVGQKVAEIVDLDPIKVVGYVSENIRSDINIGTQVEVVLPKGQKVKGKVSYVSSSSNEATRTYKVEVKIPNEDLQIKEGLTCEIHINVAKRKAHYIDPSLIVLNDKGLIGIRAVTKDNMVKFYPVEILTDESDKIWLSGLPENFTLITVGQEYVKDGSKVEISREEDMQ